MKANVREWIEASRANGIRSFYVSDYKLAQSLRLFHLRSGIISPRLSREANKVAVLAFGFDELGNVCALCADGFSRQFYPNIRI